MRRWPDERIGVSAFTRSQPEGAKHQSDENVRAMKSEWPFMRSARGHRLVCAQWRTHVGTAAHMRSYATKST
jgi:hypothetical protein